MLCYEPNGDAMRVGRDTEVYFHDLDTFYPWEQIISEQLTEDMQQLESWLGLGADPGLQIVFTRDFADEPRSISARFGSHVDGIYNRDRHIVLLEWQRGQQQLRATMRHELAHAMIASRYPNLPDWVNEGIAATSEAETGAMKWERMLRFAARRHELGPISARDVMNTPVREYDDYNDAWALCYSLLNFCGYEPLELMRMVHTETLPLWVADRAFTEMQDSLGRTLEDLLAATYGIDALQEGEADEILRFLQREGKLLVPVENPGTILSIYRMSESDGGRARNNASRILRIALADALREEMRSHLPSLEGSFRAANEEQSLEYLRDSIALERWFYAALAELLPEATNLRLDMRPRAMNRAIGRASVLLRRHGELSTTEAMHVLDYDQD
ncbi:MAG: hypothetical protein ACYTG5_20390, partial [Planctomycetota bacterium]